MCLHHAYNHVHLISNQAWIVLHIARDPEHPDVVYHPTNADCLAQMAYLNLETLKIVKGPRKAFWEDLLSQQMVLT